MSWTFNDFHFTFARRWSSGWWRSDEFTRVMGALSREACLFPFQSGRPLTPVLQLPKTFPFLYCSRVYCMGCCFSYLGSLFELAMLRHSILQPAFSGCKEAYSSLCYKHRTAPLRELTCLMASHSVTCHPAEVTYPPLPQPYPSQ